MLLETSCIAGDPAPGVPAKRMLPLVAKTDAPDVVLKGVTVTPNVVPAVLLVPPVPVSEMIPLPSAWTKAASETPTPAAFPPPRFVPPVPLAVMLPLVWTMVFVPPMATPVTEFVPVAADVPPRPVNENAPPLLD